MPVISISRAPTDHAAFKTNSRSQRQLKINVIVPTIEDFFLVVETNDMHQIISLAESHRTVCLLVK